MKVIRPRCQRCPLGREKPVARTMVFSIGDSLGNAVTRWRIDLCVQHGYDLERDIGGWGRLGQEIEYVAASSRYDPAYTEQARKAAQSRSAEHFAQSPVPARPVIQTDEEIAKVARGREPARLGDQITIHKSEN